MEVIIGIVALVIICGIIWVGWVTTPHADDPSPNTLINKEANIQMEFMPPIGMNKDKFVADCVAHANTKLGLELKVEDFKKDIPRLFRGKYIIDGIIPYNKGMKLNSNHYMMREIMTLKEIEEYKRG